MRQGLPLQMLCTYMLVVGIVNAQHRGRIECAHAACVSPDAPHQCVKLYRGLADD